ncbi:MAG: CBS domain-containing protein [Saprospiraceae bacterium]
MQKITIQEVMTTDLITVRFDETVTKIATVFKENSFHHIPIVNADDCIEGIISRTDFERIKNGMTHFRVQDIEKYNETLFQTLLTKDIMTKGVVHLNPHDAIQDAYKVFKKNKFRALPVISKGKLVGLVTPLDLLDFFFNQKNN